MTWLQLLSKGIAQFRNPGARAQHRRKEVS